MITIRRAKFEDKPAIFDFIKKAYKGRWQYKIPDRWNWEFVDNPFLESNELPVWIAMDNKGVILGQSCAMIQPIKLGNTDRRMAWGVDFFVDQKYRGQGLGSQIHKANYESHEIFMSLSMSNISRRIKTQMGFMPIEPVPTYIRVNQLGPDDASKMLIDRIIPRGAIIKRYLAKILRYLHIDQAIASQLNRTRAQMDTELAKAINSDISITQIYQFDDEIDQLWEEVSTNYHALVKRDQIYLNWKFVYQPHVEYKKLIARRHGKLCGYIIIRKGVSPEPNIGIIADMVVSPSDKTILDALMSIAVDFFAAEQVRSIITATCVNTYKECLAKFGFKKIKEDIPMVNFTKIDFDCEVSLQSGMWLLNKGDHDWDQYPLATDIP